MTDSQRLLAEYVQNGSEAAFRELVTRYIDLVYSAAIRLVDGDAHLAQDVTQAVFVDLARMARRLSGEAMLGGWLHRHACFVASKARRSERRRQSRERLAVEMKASPDHSEANLALVTPLLDEAINRLGSIDRTAILLRYFEQRDLRSVGEAMGTSENTARMRVSRALEKLHSFLSHRGVTLSAAALGTALASEAVAAAPTGLGISIAGTALVGAALGGGTTLTFINLLTMTKFQLGVISAIVIAGVATPLLVQHQSQAKLREKDEMLQQQSDQLTQLTSENERLSHLLAQAKNPPTPRLPAPPMQPAEASAEPPVQFLHPTNLFAELVKGGKTPKLTLDQIQSYLKENRRSAASLLAAFRTTGDESLLKEAMEKYPNDPRVDFDAIHRKDISPEERRQWLNTFKQSAPDNAIANYLSALDYFKAGQADLAVQELSAASGKPQFQDYSMDFLQNDEEAWRAAGYPEAEAKTIASVSLLLPQLSELKQLNRNMVDLATSYRQTGDDASAQVALQMDLNLGQRLASSPGNALITQLVGMAVERAALGAMDPATPYGATGQTVKDRLDQLAQQNTSLKNLAQQAESLQPTMTPQDWISYVDRWRTFGEENAIQWAIGKYGQK